MKNADMPAMPQERELWVEGIGNCPTEATGLTKRETMAKDMDVSGFEFNNIESLEAFIGCKVDQSSIVDIIKSQAKCNAKLKVMFADALLAELERTK